MANHRVVAYVIYCANVKGQPKPIENFWPLPIDEKPDPVIFEQPSKEMYEKIMKAHNRKAQEDRRKVDMNELVK